MAGGQQICDPWGHGAGLAGRVIAAVEGGTESCQDPRGLQGGQATWRAEGLRHAESGGVGTTQELEGRGICLLMGTGAPKASKWADKYVNDQKFSFVNNMIGFFSAYFLSGLCW